MIDDMQYYKPSPTENAEAKYCIFSLFYYETLEKKNTDLARGEDFAQIEEEFWKTLIDQVDMEDLIDMKIDHRLKIDEQEICHFFYNLLDWDMDDTVLPIFYAHFCQHETLRFFYMEKNPDFLRKYFLPFEVEHEIEGRNMVGKPDTVFRLPPTEDRYYIRDTKTSLERPSYIDIVSGNMVVNKTDRYRAHVQQVTSYAIIKEELGQKIDHGVILPIW